MKPQCTAIKSNGERCQGAAVGQHGLCWAHDPKNATQRRRTASRGGKGTSNAEVRGLKAEVRTLIADVKAGEQDRADAAVMLQGYRVLKDYVELERKVKETEEIAERLEALERATGNQEGGQRWRA